MRHTLERKEKARPIHIKLDSKKMQSILSKRVLVTTTILLGLAALLTASFMNNLLFIKELAVSAAIIVLILFVKLKGN